MKNQLILHVPHASTNIPWMDGYMVSKEELEQEMLKLTDWYTDDLFNSEEDVMIRADFSRIFCDPERYRDDAREMMAEKGMGVLYEKSDVGKLMRQVTEDYREKVLQTYYDPHHARLTQAVTEQLEAYGKVLIIDCHSYPSIPMIRDVSQRPDRPDFNIGTDEYHTPQHFIDLSVNYFESKGYSLGIDWPYPGTLVPKVYSDEKNPNVQSIMLEINRALYLQEPSNKKSDRYEEIKQVVQEYKEVLRGRLN
ncbi:N-formylglutamate amidohydrolase [Aquirufa aurantiipilula]|uniref:N-formylglutamate amidohydrolase n=1 Tax=Aquirufa aurantiipilula TaxID=2696561 RepID=A0ABT6BM91_9BACT|nr:N-formylglutamate amidohydrolase [Aquirufa aurantiipilula]MDF5691598.1 N-formylglutamate amidohydrolase [Aquirufa aurantiipilula]